MADDRATVVLEVSGVHRTSGRSTVEGALSRRPGVLAVEADPVGRTATVTYDPARTLIDDLTAGSRLDGDPTSRRPRSMALAGSNRAPSRNGLPGGLA